MKVITFQHKNVLNDIEREGKYISTIDSEFKRNTPLCYQIVFDSIKEKDIEATSPIFGWVNVWGDNDLTVNEKTIKRCMNMTQFECEDYVILELEISKDRVSLQNFYNFVDARCEEEGIDAYYDKFEDFPIECIFEIENSETQCTFSSIRKSDIINIYSFKKIDPTKYNSEYTFKSILK